MRIMRLFVTLFLCNSFLFSFQQYKPKTYQISGTVKDASTEVVMEYANVVIKSLDKDDFIDGTVTNDDGYFELENLNSGNYTVTVSYMGFNSYVIDKISIKGKSVDLGMIKLEPKILGTGEVVVEGERELVTYDIDRKIVKVSDDLLTSGNAIDVLRNAPSIDIDANNNISLHGTSGVKVLVDGRPSILSSKDILEQISAADIKHIEVITNPSAKYSANSNAGIINVIRNKEEQAGKSSIVELAGSTMNRQEGKVIVDYRKKSYGLTVAAGYTTETNETNHVFNTDYYLWDGSSYVFKTGYADANRTTKNLSVRAEFDYNLNKYNLFTLGGSYNNKDYGLFINNTEDEYYFSTLQNEDYRAIDRDRYGNYDHYMAYFNYQHKFEPEDHNVIFDIQYEEENNDDKNVLVDYYYEVYGSDYEEQDEYFYDYIREEEGDNKYLRAKIDYENKISGSVDFEAGVKGESKKENVKVLNYNEAYKDWQSFSVIDPDVYEKNIVGIYSTISRRTGDFGAKLGLRGEYYDRSVEVPKIQTVVFTNNDERVNRYSVKKWDFFPSLHLSYDISKNDKMMVGYSRRINHPSNRQLSYRSYRSSSYNTVSGNPRLDPEYTDAFELNYMRYFGKNIFSCETYYRYTDNVIRRYDVVSGDTDISNRLHNVGSEYRIGTEARMRLRFKGGHYISLTGDLYNYHSDGEVFDNNAGLVDFNDDSFEWLAKVMLGFRISTSFNIMMMYRYTAPKSDAHTWDSERNMVYTSIGYQIIPGSLSATAVCFYQSNRSSERNYGGNYKTMNSLSYDNLSFNLTLRYTFNQIDYEKEQGRRVDIEDRK